MGDTNEDNAEKGKSQVTGNWFGNLVYWFIGAVLMGANEGAAFWANVIGLW